MVSSKQNGPSANYHCFHWCGSCFLSWLRSFIHDLIRDREFSNTRLTLFGAWWLAMEILGVVTAFILWLIFLPSTKSTSVRSNRWHNRLQCLWAKSLTGGARRTIGLRWRRRISCLPQRTTNYLARHGSQGDALLTAALCLTKGGAFDLFSRTTLERSLPRHRRTPNSNYFVNRDSLNNQEELANIGAGEWVSRRRSLSYFP